MLRDAIVAEDWPRALARALEAWREMRSPALADLIDALSARIPRRVDGPRLDLHRHWMRAALAYDPILVGDLCEVVHERLMKADTAMPALVERLGEDPLLARLLHDGELAKHQRNRIERLCAIARWPDDPRAATVLARWFARDGFTLDPPHHDGPRVILEVIADLLVRLGDPRTVPIVAPCITQPRARTEELRTIQAALAKQIVDEIPPCADDPDIVGWATALSPPRAASDDDALWDAVAQDPDALAPRMVLADHLLEHGDVRGELIALQCAGDEAARQVADRLITKHWDSWLGDLALVLVRGESRFERGMLVSASLGLFGSPAWAYTATALHRELATVKRWRATSHANIDEYAKMLALRPRLDELEVNARDLPQLGAARAMWDVRALQLALTHYYNQPAPAGYVADVLVQVMRMFPTVEELHVHPPYPEQLAGALPLLARAPSLRRIVVRRSWSWLGEDGDRALRALAATFPLVELVA